MAKPTSSKKKKRRPAWSKIGRRRVTAGRELQINLNGRPDDEGFRYELLDPARGAEVDEASGLFSWTPTQRDVGLREFTVVATDEDGREDTTTFQVAVENQAPTIQPIPDQSVPVGQTFWHQVQASDPDGDSLTFHFVNPVPQLTIDYDGMISGTPATPGVISVEVQATDPHGAWARESFDLTVVNQAPTIQPIPDQSVPAGQPFWHQVQATDPEGQPLSYHFVNPVPQLSIDSSGMISGTLMSPGVVTVEVQATDPHGAFDRESFDLTVVNQAPTIQPIPDQSVPVGQSFWHQVQATDPEGQPLSYTFVNPVPQLTIDGSGMISGAPGTPGVITVEVQATDPHGAFDRETFDLTVVNQPPTLQPIADQTISLGQPFWHQVQATDPEGQPLSYTFVNPVPQLTIDGSGMISGTPSTPGVITIEVQVTDPHGAYARESFDLTIEE